MTTENAPARAYYRACVGKWKARLGVTITDPERLRASGMSWMDRTSVRMLANWPRWLGPVTLDTSVHFDGDDVVHGTVVSWMGSLPVQKSVEVFTLDADGRSLTIHGGMTGAGSVNEAADRAEYTLKWLGVEIRQRTHLVGDRITLDQEGPGFVAHQELVRVRATPRG